MTLLWSCNHDKTAELDTQQDEKSEDYLRSTYWLPVDGNTSIYNFLSQPVVIAGEMRFLIFNVNENALLVYNIQSQSLERKIVYDKEGPDAISGLGVSAGMHYVNEDTVVYFSREKELLFLANTSGKVYSKLKLTNDEVGFGSVDLYSPMTYRKGKVYLQSLPITVGQISNLNRNRPNKIAKIDLGTGQFEEIDFDFPTEYKDKSLSQQLKMIDIIYNSAMDKFVISFPLSDLIYVTDFDEYLETFSVKSDLVQEFKELDKKSSTVPESQLMNYYYWLSDAYGRLMFDPATGYYFREARSGLSEKDYLNRNLTPKKEVLVFDSSFNKVNAIPHSGTWIMYHFFGDGEIFWNKDFAEFNVKRGNEDTLYFDRVKYLKP